MSDLEHGPDCQCTRCKGFEPGNELSLRHGAYSTVALAPRSTELADEIRAVVPAYSPADEPAVRALAVVLARIERAEAALAAADTGDPLAGYEGERGRVDALERLRKDLRLWIGTARQMFGDLGMTPASRAKLKLNVALGQDAALRALERHLEQSRDDAS